MPDTTTARKSASRRALATVLQFLVGFFGAMAATLALGFTILGVLVIAVPQWQSKWAMAGALEKLLWIAPPTLALLGGSAVLLWRKHRAIAIGILAYMVADAVAAWCR